MGRAPRCGSATGPGSRKSSTGRSRRTTACGVLSARSSSATFSGVNKGMNRRQFLRGAGVAVALPVLERFAFAKGAEAPRRILAVCNNLGLLPEKFFPTAPGREYALSPYLERLKDHRNDFTVFSGVMHP